MTRSKKKRSSYKVKNWAKYNNSLKQRGSLSMWFSDDFDQNWEAQKENGKKGRPVKYSDNAIEMMLSLRYLLKLPLRQVTGFVESIFRLIGKDLAVPNFSRLSRRSMQALSRLNFPQGKEDTHIVIDSTGLKVYGESEWLETKWGKQYKRKVWRKIHIATDKNSKIVAQVMTDHKTDDRCIVPKLLSQIDTGQITELLTDRGYDSHLMHKFLEEQEIKALIPPLKTAVVNSKEDPTSRDKIVQYIKLKGYFAWHVKNDFGRRNNVENTFYRLKTIFGRKLLSRSIDNQQAEVNLICHLLNKITDLGMPISVKLS